LIADAGSIFNIAGHCPGESLLNDAPLNVASPVASLTSLIGNVETFIADPRNPDLLKWARAAAKRESPLVLADALRRIVSPELDYTTASGLARLLAQLRARADLGERKVKIAFLASYTAKPLAALVELFLAGGNVAAEIYQPEYGTFRQELIDPTSDFHAFRPEYAIISATWRDLGRRPGVGDDKATVDTLIAAEVAEWQAYWGAAQSAGAQVIQDNFVSPPWRALGNIDGSHPAGLTRYVTLLNQALQDAAPASVTIHDVDSLAAEAGRWKWSDERFFHEAKLPCAPEMLPDYGHRLAQIVLAQSGVSRKCLALDLDNTLWGGVIGEDGLNGIAIGQGDTQGEAFLAFQHYVLALKRRGVILAVCSKNTEAIAREAFERHPGMAIRMDDIACFMANWDDKATNLGRIAEQLNIGLNSLVFVDDNPVERSIIRQLRPEVAVPEMPENPAGYIEALDRKRYFETVAISCEDLRRTAMYHAEAARKAVVSSADDLEGFLRSLELVATVGPVDASSLERTVQLINRSNQFNVTTRRHSSADLLAMIGDDNWITLTISLKDRFGDNGLISVILARIERDAGALAIDTWLMSCRVLKRGVEDAALNHLAMLARKHGLAAVTGEYIPTAKNVLVKDLFATLGFSEVAKAVDGASRWSLTVDDMLQPRKHMIEMVEK
jgi:FkbH-like protein